MGGNIVRFRTRVAAVAATLPLVLGVAACGGGQKQAATDLPAATPSATVSTTTAAPPAAAQPAAHLSTASFLPAMKTGMAGKNSVRVNMRMVAGGEVMTVTGVQTMKPVAMQIDLNGAAFGGRMKMILVKDTLYLSMKGIPAGKFVKVDTKDSADPMAASLGSVLKEVDPSKTFGAFDSGLKNAKYIRTETVDGRKVDRYEVTVDMAAALKAKGQKVTAGMPKTLVYTVWMGSADHLTYTVAFELAGVSMTMNASDWGKPVTIKAPPASKIVSR
jgi:hypothetical protein